MLEPDGRQSLLDALRPPAGFALDRAVGTTFSLDLHALLTAPLAFALLDSETTDDGATSPTAILEGIRRNASLLDVFCQAGQIPLPPEYRPLLAYVEEVVHEVTAPTKGRVFHPKLWVLRFRAPGGERSYRLLCLSRNLTFDRSWDTVLQLDGNLARRTRKLTSRNRPLSKFLEFLPQRAANKLEKARGEAVRELADEILAVEFELPSDFYGLRFWPLGIKGLPAWPFAEESWTHSRLLIVSPFLSPDLLGRLHAPGARDALVSRAETLDTLDETCLAQFEERLAMSSAASGSDGPETRQLGPEDEELAETPEFPLSGLHAKLFVSEYHHMARLWTGSANATNAAFAGNVEFLVELQGARSACGVDAVLEGQSGGVKWRDLLETYEPSGLPPAETDQQRLERRLDQARRELAALGFEATVLAEEGNEEAYAVLVTTRAQGRPDAMRRIQGRMWPITIDSGGAKPLAQVFGKGIRYAPLSFGALTAFYAVELEAESRGVRASIRFVIAAVLMDAPSDRFDRLLTTILRDKSEVLRYLVLLLADEHLASAIGSWQSADGQGEGWGAPTGLPVLESMVRALARDPDRLDHVARLIESLRATEEGRALIPDGLDAVWQPIWEARRRLRS